MVGQIACAIGRPRTGPQGFVYHAAATLAHWSPGLPSPPVEADAAAALDEPMDAPAPPNVRLNLSKASILLLDSPLGVEVLVQILAGFQATHFHRCSNVARARAVSERTRLDLVIAEIQLREGEPDGCDFVHWLRRSGLEPNAFVPVILVSAHTSQANVSRARDCGSNFMVAKPLAPSVLLERILWVAREHRHFIEAGPYVGPERRFHDVGPPPGMTDRRSHDPQDPLAELSMNQAMLMKAAS